MPAPITCPTSVSTLMVIVETIVLSSRTEVTGWPARLTEKVWTSTPVPPPQAKSDAEPPMAMSAATARRDGRMGKGRQAARTVARLGRIGFGSPLVRGSCSDAVSLNTAPALR